jgi:hypothetical protein
MAKIMFFDRSDGGQDNLNKKIPHNLNKKIPQPTSKIWTSPTRRIDFRVNCISASQDFFF